LTLAFVRKSEYRVVIGILLADCVCVQRECAAALKNVILRITRILSD